MRALVTWPLTILFAVAFSTFALVDSVARYAADADAVVATARRAGVRDRAAEAATAWLYERVRAEPAFADASRPAIRQMVDGVVTDAWLDETLRRAHAAAMAAVDGARDRAAIDLRATKAALAGAVEDLVARAAAACAELAGPKACADDRRARSLMAAFRARGRRAIAQIPDEIDLARAVARDGGDAARLDELRAWIGDARALWWAGLAALAVCLALLAAVNGPRLRDRARAVAWALAFGVALTFGAMAGARAVASGRLQAAVTELRGSRAPRDPAVRALVDGGEVWAARAVDDALARRLPALAVLGGAAVVAGVLAGRRRSR
ncbi:MAG: hypothetical protein D6689_04195 [Deltaproteobacteria bacterium]|nr:MAG: hypothetical protein D6689_04195 [Deltaproteobacteria bacterium]